jgi:hypothetical protein
VTAKNIHGNNSHAARRIRKRRHNNKIANSGSKAAARGFETDELKLMLANGEQRAR